MEEGGDRLSLALLLVKANILAGFIVAFIFKLLLLTKKGKDNEFNT